MTDLRLDDFDPRDLPAAEDAPPVEAEPEPASHDDEDNPDVVPAA
jgi:hypothetical protein